ncbi:MAG: ABC transporter ATP-binding protein [Gemmiger sp.]|nr:ABC transporter ATP-binding protein [Gemmiger sp.]
METKEILRMEGVCYRYEGSDTPALQNCTLALHAGERATVLGNNGAGKSTFFLLANGVRRPTAGTLWLNGQPVGKKAAEQNALRRSVGLVFQDPEVQLLGGTVEEEISFGPMNLGLPEGEVRQRVARAMEALGLAGYRGRAPQYLSGGEKKRVSIADVLAMEPQLILLDEPAASLDPAGRKLLEAQLAMLHGQGFALAVATHDLDFAWRWAERVLVFCGGVLVADAPPATVFADAALLEKCHLEQPLLYQVGCALGIAPPRSVAALKAALQQTERHP